MARAICLTFLILSLSLLIAGKQSSYGNIQGRLDTAEILKTVKDTSWQQSKDMPQEQLELGIPVAREVIQPIAPWILWLFFGQFLSIALARYLFPPLMNTLSRNITNYNIAWQSFRHSEQEPTAVDMILRINALITIAFMGVFSLVYYLEYAFSWQMVSAVAAVAVVFYMFRKLVMQLIGGIFRFGEVLRFTNFYSDYLIKGVGIVSFPLLLVYLFSSGIVQQMAIYLFILALAIFILLRFLRGLKAGWSLFLGSAFHFILYICTLEIIPLLLICKLFVMYFGSM
jgi:hypothetical protein